MTRGRGDQIQQTIRGGRGHTQIVGFTQEEHEASLQKAREELRAELEAKFAETRRADEAEAKAARLEIELLQQKLGALDRSWPILRRLLPSSRSGMPI